MFKYLTILTQPKQIIKLYCNYNYYYYNYIINQMTLWLKHLICEI